MTFFCCGSPLIGVSSGLTLLTSDETVSDLLNEPCIDLVSFDPASSAD